MDTWGTVGGLLGDCWGTAWGTDWLINQSTNQHHLGRCTLQAGDGGCRGPIHHSRCGGIKQRQQQPQQQDQQQQQRPQNLHNINVNQHGEMHPMCFCYAESESVSSGPRFSAKTRNPMVYVPLKTPDVITSRFNVQMFPQGQYNIVHTIHDQSHNICT